MSTAKCYSLTFVILISSISLLCSSASAANWSQTAHSWGGSSTDSATSVTLDAAGNALSPARRTA